MYQYTDYYTERKMKISFEIHTTASKPIILSFNKDIPMPHFYESLIDEIEYNTIFTEDTIIDIFAEDSISNDILSLSDYDRNITLEQFITLNRNFFPFMPITKNYYNIFVIDKMYLTRTRSNIDTPIYKKTKYCYNINFKELKNSLSKYSNQMQIKFQSLLI